MFERPFGQTSESAKKAEEFLAGSGLELESEDSQNRGQFVDKRVKEISSIDKAFEPTIGGKKIMEDNLKNVNMSLEEEKEKNFGQSIKLNDYNRAIKPTEESKKIIKKSLEGSGLELEDKSNQDFGQHLRRNS